LHSSGLGTVLSMMSGTPCAWATSATAAMSSTTMLGLPRLSAYTARVLGRMAAAKASGWVASTKVVSMPNLARLTASIVTEPPYKAPAATTWSPDLQEGHQCHGFGRHARGTGHGGAPAFECCHAFFEHRHRGVAQARIHIAKGLQVEQRCRVLGAVKHKAAGLVNRQGACARGRIGNLPSMDGQGFGVELAVGHGVLIPAAAPR
jgi:hypothetical protein